MSDRISRGAGIILAAAALALCLVPALSAGNGQAVRYRSGERQESGISEIRTETNGSVAVNTADAEELTELHGVGETISALIVAEREANGPYYYAEDLESVRGIGPATLAGFREMIDLSQEEGRN